jgi:hypothetical protein
VFIEDVTKKLSHFAHPAGATNSAIFIGLHGLPLSGTPGPVVPFANLRFWSAEMDGSTVAEAGGTAYDIVTSSDVLQVHTGVLASTGDRFALYFKHS